jgi:hypothetical protein
MGLELGWLIKLARSLHHVLCRLEVIELDAIKTGF